MNGWPELAHAIVQLLRDRPGLPSLEIQRALGEPQHRVYQALNRLESAGRVWRDESWPRKWYAAEPSDAVVDAVDAVGGLLTEAMQLPEWKQTPVAVRLKVEHAWVQLQREAMALEVACIPKTTSAAGCADDPPAETTGS